MNDHDHPDDELVSAYLDGEATPEEAARVEADPALRARLDDFRTVRDAVATGPLPPAGALDEAVAAAVGADAAGPASRRRSAAWLGPLATAAVILLVLVALPLVLILGSGGGDSGGDADRAASRAAEDDSGNAEDDSGAAGDAAGPELSTTAPASEFAPAPATGGAAAADGLVDFGKVSSEDELKTLVFAYASRSGAGASGPDRGDEPAEQDESAGEKSSSAHLLDSGGCSERLTAGDATLGTLVYVARLEFRGSPALLYGYTKPDGDVLARLVVATGPECTVLARVNR